MRLLVVDISNIFWTIALAGSVASGTAARDWSIRDIREAAKGYDRVVVAVDGDDRDPDWPQPSWRTRVWPKYKAGRKERPAHLWPLLSDTIRHCEAEGWIVVRAPMAEDGGEEGGHGPALFFEADDVIGSVVAWASPLGHAVDILSGDSDLAQLVVDSPPAVRQIRRDPKVRERVAMNAAAVLAWEKLGVRPEHVADLKAIAGDSGDGYGDLFPGIGDKTARELLARADWSALVVADKSTKAVNEAEAKGEKVNRHCKIIKDSGGIERAALGLTLAKVRTDLPLDLSPISAPPERKPIPSVAEALVPRVEDAEVEDEPAAAPPAPLMTTALATIDPTARMLIAPREVNQRLLEFQALIKAVLVPGVDYGTIPNCGDKPALFKSGAEKFAEVYGYAPYFEIMKAVERWEDPPLFFYRVKCCLRRKVDGAQVAECVGSANSRETKWGARWAYERDVPSHLDVTKLRRREFRPKKPRSPDEMVVQYQVPNEAIFDQTNTIVKMAQKRAFVGAVLLATRASGVFAADVDDLAPEYFGTASDRSQWEP
jgi:5'-3' exonuclease